MAASRDALFFADPQGPSILMVEDFDMSRRRHSADLRGRRYDLGIGVRDMAAGLGIGLARVLSIEDGIATDEDKTFYRTWLTRIEGWSSSQRHVQLGRARAGQRFR
jgi:hypothetical protein